MKRQLLVFCIGYIIGIIWGLYCKCSIALLYLLIISTYYFINFYSRIRTEFKLISVKRYIRYAKIFLKFNIIITIIISSFISNIIVLKLNNKYNTLYNDLKEIEAIAIVIDNGKNKNDVMTYKIKIEQIDNNYKYKNTLLYLKTNKRLQFGDKIRIKGLYTKPSIQRNYKGFNYKEYLKTKKVYGLLKAKKIEIIDSDCINFISKYSNICFLNIKYKIEKTFPNQISQLFLGIMLGYTDEMDEDIKVSFQANNLSHILAVSGMHISYIVMGLTLVFQNRIGKQKNRIVIIIILCLYMCLAGFSPSIVRASIMGIINLMAGLLHRKNDVWTSIALSFLLIVLYNPYLINSVGVLFSYSGTIGIIILYNNVLHLLEKIKFKDKKYRINKKIKKIAQLIREILAITISAQIGILPIMICFFNKISIFFLFSNLIVSFIICPIVILGFIMLAIAAILPVNLLNIMSYILFPLLKILLLISDFFEKIPINQIYICTPTGIQIFLYYIIIIFVNFLYSIYLNKKLSASQIRIKNLISLLKFKCRLKKKTILISCVAMCIIICSINCIPGNLNIFFIDVGQGDSTLIRTPFNKTILIDGGGSLSENYDVGKNVLLPYLLSRGVKKIDYLIISHFDQDHYQGCAKVIEELKVKKIIICKQTENSENYENFKKLVEKIKTEVIFIKKRK